MRTIEIIRDVEVWPGRRLYANGLLINLPRGCMSVIPSTTSATLNFGSPSRTTVAVTGTPTMIGALASAIVDMERPSEGARTIQ